MFLTRFRQYTSENELDRINQYLILNANRLASKIYMETILNRILRDILLHPLTACFSYYSTHFHGKYDSAIYGESMSWRGGKLFKTIWTWNSLESLWNGPKRHGNISIDEVSRSSLNSFHIFHFKLLCTIVTFHNRPFYSYGWKRGWGWPCFDTNLLCFVMEIVLEKY